MIHQNETDETLVMLTLAGEQTAYEALVVRYQKTVISSARAVTKTQFMAEDAAQDAFVTAWMKLNTLQEPQKFGSWVCRIARNYALNMITRYRGFISLDDVDNLNVTADTTENPAEFYALSEERNEVDKSIEKLPEKVRQIIRLHYFEDLSVSEIADRMRISEGTVKRQLHDGRKQIGKEPCAMNEKYSDTLVQRVMKKVEELKLWQVKNDKSGFEKAYAEVLREVEELPECTEKQHALAVTPMQKAHTKAAVSAAKRIFSTSPSFHPECTATGHWNCGGFVRQRKTGGGVRGAGYRYAFLRKVRSASKGRSA